MFLKVQPNQICKPDKSASLRSGARKGQTFGSKPNGLGFNFLQMDSVLDIGIASDFTLQTKWSLHASPLALRKHVTTGDGEDHFLPGSGS